MRTAWLATVAVTAALLGGATAQGVSAAPVAPGDGADAGALSAIGSRAFAEIAGCTAGAETLLVDVVVDESGSLRSTDPSAQRVGGILTAVDALQSLAAQEGSDLDVQVALSTFAEGYEIIVPLATLDDGHADRLRAAAADQLPARNTGQLTDYRQALRGAQQTLDGSNAVQQGRSSCRVALWFTDGGLDVGPDTAAALSDLCQPRGLVDGVRSGGMTVIALALFTEEGRGSVTADQRSQLRAAVEGQEPGGPSCGTAPIPSDSAAGAYLRADDAGSLRRLFAGAGALIAGGTQAGSASCPSMQCTDGATSLLVDPGVAGARLVVEGSTVAGVRLQGPGGGLVDLTDVPEAPVPGGQARVTRRDGLVIVSLAFEEPEGAQVGDWWVTAVDDAGAPVDAETDRYFFWGAQLDLTTSGLVVGEGGEIVVRLSAGGETLRPDLYRDVDVVTTVDGAQMAAQRTDEGYLLQVDLEDGSSDSAVSVAVEATAVTDSGVPIGPVSAQVQLPTELPAAFASVTPTSLTLPGLSGTGRSTGSLTLRGSERSDNTVCVRAGQLVAPPQATALTLQVPDCLTVAAGSTIELPVAVVAGEAAEGQVSGDVVLTLTDAVSGKAQQLTVPVGLTMTRPVDEPLRWGLVALFTILAAALPLLLMYIGNLLVARFAVSDRSRFAVVPVELTPSGVRRPDGKPVLGPDDFQWFPGGRSARKGFSLAGATWRRRLPVWPLQEPHATVSAGEAIVVSNVGEYSSRDGLRAPADFGLATTWVLVVDPTSVASDSARATLVLVNEDDEGLRGIIEARTRDLREFNGWHSVWERVQQARASRDVAPAGAAGSTTTRSGGPGALGGSGDLPAAPAEDRPSSPFTSAGSVLDEPPPRRGFSAAASPPSVAPTSDRPPSPFR